MILKTMRHNGILETFDRLLYDKQAEKSDLTAFLKENWKLLPRELAQELTEIDMPLTF